MYFEIVPHLRFLLPRRFALNINEIFECHRQHRDSQATKELTQGLQVPNLPRFFLIVKVLVQILVITPILDSRSLLVGDTREKV